MLRVQQLDMLLHLVESGSISQTAEKMGLTQSAVTKSLKELESGFGVRLFERTSRGLHATIYGEVVERFSHDVVIGLQSALDTIRALRLGERGHVAIGMVPGASQTLVARALQRVRAKTPELSIELRVEGTELLLDALHAGYLDFALVHPSAALDLERYEYVPAGQEALHALVRPEHPQLQPNPGLGLLDAAWAVPPREEPLRQLVEATMASAGFPFPSDIIELPLHAGAAELACQLDIIALLPHSLVESYLHRGVLRIVELPFVLPSLPFGLLRARHAEASAGACAVLRELLHAIDAKRKIVPDTQLAARDGGQ